MFFIYGWGQGATEDFGPTLPIHCPNCNNKTFWHLCRRQPYFMLFFIRFPVSTKHFYACPICSRGVPLEGQGLEEAIELNDAACNFFDGSLPEADFQARVRLVAPSIPLLLEASASESAAREPDSPPVTHCRSCGFRSFNAVATTCPDCREPLVPWSAPID